MTKHRQVRLGRVGKLWTPAYGHYSLNTMLQRLSYLEEELKEDSKALIALGKSEVFIRNSFANYRSKERTGRYGFGFAVPTRIERGSERYYTEALHFLPIVEWLDPDARQRLISGLPPCLIDEYTDSDGEAYGAILLIPLFMDMVKDIRSGIQLKLIANKIIADSARFARDDLGISVLGLGATLPKLTKFGARIRRHGIVTTTGHGGTVYIIVKTLEAVMEKRKADFSLPIGCIGAGSIGASSADLVLQQVPDARILIYDTRPPILAQVVESLGEKYGRHRIVAAQSNAQVLSQSQFIISAVTSAIPVAQDIDLSGKVIIDDSQPASFDKGEVETHGGKVVWVVAHDSSSDSFLTRRSDYRFGEEGLLHKGDVWGCEAEVGSLWRADRLDLALAEQVSPEKALQIGKIMYDTGMTLAAFQQEGGAVRINGS